jgi:hypothetical protein
MADSLSDGRTKVYWVTSIASPNAPTTAELNAGTRLENLMTPDGLVGFEPDTADVDVSALDSLFDTKVAGRGSFSGTILRIKKQSGVDAVYNLLVRDLAGYVAVRRDVTAGTAWTTADKVEIYPSILGEVRNLPPESNSVHKYEVPVKISSSPFLRATVA